MRVPLNPWLKARHCNERCDAVYQRRAQGFFQSYSGNCNPLPSMLETGHHDGSRCHYARKPDPRQIPRRPYGNVRGQAGTRGAVRLTRARRCTADSDADSDYDVAIFLNGMNGPSDRWAETEKLPTLQCGYSTRPAQSFTPCLPRRFLSGANALHARTAINLTNDAGPRRSVVKGYDESESGQDRACNGTFRLILKR